MVVLDQFYQIIDRKTRNVSAYWKAGHILSWLVCVVCGFLTSFTFGRVLDDFNYNCVLNSDIVFDHKTVLNTSKFDYNFTKPILAIDLVETIWGKQAECNFVQFIPLLSMISAIIWGMYFMVLSRGGTGYSTDVFSKPWTIIYPCIIFSTVMVIIGIVSFIMMKDGLEAFCKEFQSEFGNSECVPEMDVYAAQFHENRQYKFYYFYANYKVTSTCSEIGIWAWIAQLALCIGRVLGPVDFRLQLVTISSKEGERVENVINFQDMPDDTVSEV